MNDDITLLNKKWNKSKSIASGRTVIEIFGAAAMESWVGAEALIDAYLELEEKTGESPSRDYVSDQMYFKIKEYWGDNLGAEQLDKLNEFLSRLNNE